MRRIMLLCALLVGLISGAALGGLPRTMSYQGVLMNSDGSQAADSTYAVIFRLYDVESGGADIWSEVDTVATDCGIFNVILGKTTPLGLDFDETYWLGLEIDGSELTPRTELTPSPYTFRAAVSDSAVEATHAAVADSARVVGEYSDEDWTISGDDMYSAVPGSVGIGTDTPTAKFDIDADADVAMNIASEGHGALIEYQRDGGEYRFYAGIPDATNSRWDVQDASHNSILAVQWDGKVGINTNSSGATLQVHGNPLSRIHLTHPGTGTSWTRGVHIGYPCETCRDFIIWSYEDQPLRFGTQGTERLRIDAIGNVGIGTISPAQRLDVQGNARISGKLGIGTTSPVAALDVNGETHLREALEVGAGGIRVQTIYTGDAITISGATGDGLYIQSADSYGVDASGHQGNWLGTTESASYGLTVESALGSAANKGLQVKGKADITGTVTKGGGSFKIDHPLDPENKYLYHSFVESPDMMNIYNGNVILDAGGEAWVEMPEWFEPLNRDFRYQLTCIGGFAPVYVDEEVRGNRFKVAGGEPGMKVSWQVTGIRHDPFAEMYRIPVEENKEGSEMGKYQYPEAFGQPASMGVCYENRRSHDSARD